MQKVLLQMLSLTKFWKAWDVEEVLDAYEPIWLKEFDGDSGVMYNLEDNPREIDFLSQHLLMKLTVAQ